MIGCCKWLDRPTVRLFLFHAKRRENNNKINIFLSMDRLKEKKQVKEQIYLFLNKFRGYFFFTFYRDVHLPVVGLESFFSWHLTTVDTRRPGDWTFFRFIYFFFIFDFYLNTFFFHIVMYIFWRCWRCHEKAIHHATRSFAFWNQTRNQRRRNKKK